MSFISDYFYKRDKTRRIKSRKAAYERLGMTFEKGSKDVKTLSKGQGMYIGGWFNPHTKQVEALMDNGSTHIMVVAPTRAGKGVGIVLPTMLSWTGSTVVHDIKRELWNFTSGHRQAMGQKVLRFDPVIDDGSSVKYNPLEEIRLGTQYEVKDIQNIAEMLMNPQGSGKDGDNAHWTNSAIDLCMGFILHMMYDKSVPKSEKNLGGLLKNLSLLMLSSAGEEDPAAAAFTLISSAVHAYPADEYYWTKDALGNRVHTHPKVREMAGRMLAKGDKERASVISSALANLGLYADPIVANNTMYSEFRLDDLMNHERPVNLYLVSPPNDAERIRPLFRLIVTQILNHVTSDMKFKDGSATPEFNNRLLLMLDEFASLGKMNVIPTAFTFMAGYGVKACIILQTASSLKATYGNEQADVIMANCHTRVFFSPNDQNSADDISKACGKKKVVSIETSVSGKRTNAYLDSTSISQKEEMVDLISAAEALQMPKDEIIIMHQGIKPIRGRKFYYYKVPYFNERSKIKPPETDRLNTVDEANIATPEVVPPEVAPPMSVASFLAKIRAEEAEAGRSLPIYEEKAEDGYEMPPAEFEGSFETIEDSDDASLSEVSLTEEEIRLIDQAEEEEAVAAPPPKRPSSGSASDFSDLF